MLHLGILPVALALSTPSGARSDLEKGLAGAIRGCAEWVLNPASWVDGPGPFIAAVGVGNQMAPIEKVDEAALPPPEMRVANHYWRINSTSDAGYILVVSDRLPMCHITGGGGTDLEPVVEAVLASSDFQDGWTKVQESPHGDVISTTYRSRRSKSFSMTISRASAPNQRLDRIQVLATATLHLKD